MTERKTPVRKTTSCRTTPRKATLAPQEDPDSLLTTKGAIHLPPEALADLEVELAAFNRKKMKNTVGLYVATVSGKCAFVGRRLDPNRLDPLFKLDWKGAVDNWAFAIYRYSQDEYDPDAYFPGCGLVDGTVAGALKAAHKAYPPDWWSDPDDGSIFLAGLLGLASHLPPGRGGRGREVDAEVQNLYAHQIVDTSWLRYEDYRKWAFDYEIEARAKTDANFLPVTSAVHELSGWAFFMDSDRAPTRMPGLFRKAYNKALKDVAARDELGTGEPASEPGRGLGDRPE